MTAFSDDGACLRYEAKREDLGTLAGGGGHDVASRESPPPSGTGAGKSSSLTSRAVARIQSTDSHFLHNSWIFVNKILKLISACLFTYIPGIHANSTQQMCSL